MIGGMLFRVNQKPILNMVSLNHSYIIPPMVMLGLASASTVRYLDDKVQIQCEVPDAYQ